MLAGGVGRNMKRDIFLSVVVMVVEEIRTGFGKKFIHFFFFLHSCGKSAFIYFFLKKKDPHRTGLVRRVKIMMILTI